MSGLETFFADYADGPYEHEMQDRMAELEADNATLRALLAEAAPKCANCDQPAMFECDDGTDYYACEAHAQESVYPYNWRPYDLGARIKAALEGKP
jgi:hypothetical protein